MSGQSSAILELKPEQAKFYLKLIIEAIWQLKEKNGSLRKDIWDYLN